MQIKINKTKINNTKVAHLPRWALYNNAATIVKSFLMFDGNSERAARAYTK